MKITLTGTNIKTQEEIEVTIEFQGGKDWVIKVGNTEVVVTDLEKAMKFLKEDSEASK